LPAGQAVQFKGSNVSQVKQDESQFGMQIFYVGSRLKLAMHESQISALLVHVAHGERHGLHFKSEASPYLVGGHLLTHDNPS
jgi:hypothetical protein